MNTETFDAIVIGTGGVGSAAMYHLAKSGVRVLGLDRFPTAHDKGSSHGESRVIRKSYFEHPNYVPLVQQSWRLWEDLQQEANRQLLQPTGVIYFGAEDGVVMSGLRQSSEQHGLSLERLSSTEAASRYPQFVGPPNTTALYEADAGVLLVEEAIRTQIQLAVAAGATHQTGDPVVRWSANSNSVTVETQQHRYEADRLIVTAGAWSAELLSSLNIPLQVIRKHQHWYSTNDQQFDRNHGCPAFFFEHQDAYFYGVPQIDGSGVKVCEHSGGTVVDDPLNDHGLPQQPCIDRLEKLVRECMPTVTTECQRHETCFYTMTPDEHFIIDRHPELANVCFAAGLSGHGFKFGPVLGRTLAQLAAGMPMPEEAYFLRVDRPDLQQTDTHS